MNIADIESVHKQCRSCLAVVQPTEVVKDENENGEVGSCSLLSPNICRIFLDLTTLDASQELEEFPKQLCVLCSKKILDYEDFREKAFASTRLLYYALNVHRKTAVEEAKAQGRNNQKSFSEMYINTNAACHVVIECDVNAETEHFDSFSQSSAAEINDCSFEVKGTQLLSPIYDRYSESHDSQSCVNGNEDNINSEVTVIPKPKRFKGWHCVKCNKKFHFELTFKAHILKVHHGVQKPFSCEKCSKSFSTNRQLVLHTDEACGKKSDTILKDNVHYKFVKQRGLNSKKTEGTQTCEICNKKLSDKRSLQLHMMRHKNVKKFQCPKCHVRKTTKHEVTFHMQIHDENSGKFECPQCAQLFSHKHAVMRHVKAVHERLKLYSCSKCPKRFATHNAQLLHEKHTHAVGRDFVCKMCYRSFTIEKTFQNHLKKHTKIPCNLCKNRFMNLKTLADHQKTHLGDNPIVCSVCSHGFYNVLDLKDHQKQHEKDGTLDKGNAECGEDEQMSTEREDSPITIGTKNKSKRSRETQKSTKKDKKSPNKKKWVRETSSKSSNVSQQSMSKTILQNRRSSCRISGRNTKLN